MADLMYDAARDAFARGEIRWRREGGEVVRACFTRKAYRPDRGHVSFADLGGNAVGHHGGNERVDCPQLAIHDPSAGACAADQVGFLLVPRLAGPCPRLVIFHDSGTDEASTLLVCLDSTEGLPLKPNGGDVLVKWQEWIFRL